jgi:uncharacterized protein YjbI with pentapeptide repeats
MADVTHLNILKQGIDIWNKWREKHSEIIPDLTELGLFNAKLNKVNLVCAKLSGAHLVSANFIRARLIKADLFGADLREAKFQQADLTQAYLCEAVLRGANFNGANLLGANLIEVDLCEATLRGTNLIAGDLLEANLHSADLYGSTLNGANLERTILSRANLSNTQLRGTKFMQTHLEGASFEGAIIGWTIFADVDLSTIIGLDSLRHEGPSTVGIDTIIRSKGNIPEVFLRGCGLPDEFIDYIPSLVGKGIEYYSCFISYSHRDDDFAKRLHNDLQAKGVRCWFAPHDMKIGDKIRTTIDDSIRLHDKLLLILSEHSVESDWVEHEVEHALDLERERKKTSLFPVKIDDTIMESTTGWAGNVKRQRHIGDFTQWKQHDDYQAAFDRLLRDLKA